MDYILRDIPEDLHRRFKVKCVERGISMREAIIAIMGEDVARREEGHEAEGRRKRTPAAAQ